MNNTELFNRSLKVVPGGVHSPVRSFKGLDYTPRFIKKGDGAYIWDEEDKRYIDFCMSFGPLILGHNNPQVKEAIIQAVYNGWSYGACERYSLELAEFMINHISFIEQVRFVNSGTEAVMTALRLARGYTGKSKIIKFNGCYHGHVDSMLIKAGSGLAGTAEASSLGIPASYAEETLIVELNDLENLKQCFEDHKNQIAAVIIEPLPANNGLLTQSDEFLKGVQKLCKENYSLLIFDEVISGFRVAFGGMAEETGIIPDIVTYGKIIGGGMPVGAIAGSAEIMKTLAPLGGVYQAGTLSANPVAMQAGLACLKVLSDQQFYPNLEKITAQVCDLFFQWFSGYKEGEFSDYAIHSKSSLFWIVPSKEPLKSINEIPADIMTPFNKLENTLLPKGIYLSPNPYEVGFASSAHENVLDHLKESLWS